MLYKYLPLAYGGTVTRQFGRPHYVLLGGEGNRRLGGASCRCLADTDMTVLP